MEWKDTTGGSFLYNGKRVTRQHFKCSTIFGMFEVFHAVGGRCFYRHPFLNNNPYGFPGYNPDPDHTFGKPQKPCKDIEEGKAICEEVMAKLKEKVAAY